MNKKLVALLVLCIAAITAFGCTSGKQSSENPPAVEPEHEHVYVWIDEAAATCKNVGLRAHYACSSDDCDLCFDENKNEVDLADLIIPLADHEYYYVDNGDGTHSKKCDGCEFLATAAHAYTREVIADTFLKSSADCYAAAVYYKSCECGKFDNGESAETFVSGEALGHDFNDEKVCARCELDMGSIVKEIENLPAVSGITLSSIGGIKEAYEKWNLLGDVDKAAYSDIDAKIEALYEKVSGIEVLSADLWKNDPVHGSLLSYTLGTDELYGDYAEVSHSKGWAFMYLDAEKSPSGYVVFYAYNPADVDMVYTYGHVNDSLSDNIFKGEDRYHVTLKAQSWTRISFDYELGYDISKMRIVRGDKAGDTGNVSGLKFSAWYLVDDVSVITEIVSDKTITYTIVEAVTAGCETSGKEKHYVGSNGKLYNLYKEEVTADDLTIAPTGHSYNDEGVCSACGASLAPVINEIAALCDVNDISLADVNKIFKAYENYAALSNQAKAFITNSEKLLTLYDAVKDITVYGGKLVSGGLTGTTYNFAPDTDEEYGDYQAITQNGTDWANFGFDISDTPAGKYLVFYVYNPLESDIGLVFGDTNVYSVYEAAKCLHFNLKAQKWSRVSVEWTYVYSVAGSRMCLGSQAGNYTSTTGFKFTSVYVVDDVNVITEIVSDKTITYTIVDAVAAGCETSGMEKHYADSNGKLYNLYKEEVTADDLTIAPIGHKYGADGACVNAGCTAKLEMVADINVLCDVENITVKDIADIQKVYEKYSDLGDEAKALITNSEKLIALYNAVSSISVYDSAVAWAGQCSADNVTTKAATDEDYGACYEITLVSGWANFKANVAVTPVEKYAVFYIYNPLATDLTITFGTASTIYDANSDALRFNLAANGWTRVAIEWTYAYNVASGIFVTGAQAGDGTNITGMKVSNLFVVDSVETIAAFDGLSE